MLKRKISTATAVGLAALLSATTVSAMDSNFNAKEINGRTDYLSVAIVNSDMANISWRESREATTSESRNGRTAKFDDPDGFIGAFGQDYGYVRLETEFGYRETSVTSISGQNNVNYTDVDSDINIGTAMVNVAFEYSFDPGKLAGSESVGFSLTPYVTAGAGMLGAQGKLHYLRADGNVKENINDEFFIAPSLQAGVGLTVGLPFGAELFGQYSEMFGSTYNIRSSDDIHIKSVSGGLRVNF